MSEEEEDDLELNILGSMKVKGSLVCDARKKRKRKRKSSEEKKTLIKQEEVNKVDKIVSEIYKML